MPGEPYLIRSSGQPFGELAQRGCGLRDPQQRQQLEAKVTDAAGAVRDLRRSKDGNYVSVVASATSTPLGR